jgi:hypothetical protein
MQTNVNRMETNTNQCKPMQTNAKPTPNQHKADASQCKPMQTNANQCKATQPMQTNATQFEPVFL